MGDPLRRRVVQSFKLQGLTLQSQAAGALAEVLEPFRDSGELEEVVDCIVEAVQKQPLTSSLVNREAVLAAVEEVNQASDSDKEGALEVIDAFHTPKFTFNSDQKKFLPIPRSSLSLHSSADSKAALFRSRYTLILQQTARHELFAPSTFGQLTTVDSSHSKFQLRRVEGLLGETSFSEKIIVLGALTRLKEGKIHLEDPTGCVELDLSETVFHTGLFVESSLVLAEGVFEDEVFHVSAIGFPPPEPPSVTRTCFGSVNFFGGLSRVCAKSSEKLQAMLKENEDAMMVFLSDVFLDQPRVMESLATLFSGYSEAPPTAFVFMGNFSSTPYGPLANQKLRQNFKNLAELMSRYPELVRNSQFFFVPGPQDPGPGSPLPRPSIPSVLTSDLTSRVPTARFCSNPVRIRFCTREVVVFREDLMGKMCRLCVRFPNSSTDLSTHFTKTLLSQAHLCPLPIHSLPVYWDFDHALQLHPLPDLVVIGDKCDPFTVTSGETTVTNTGSFLRSDFEFKVYIPFTGQVEDSKIAS